MVEHLKHKIMKKISMLISMIILPIAILLFPVWINNLWWFLISWFPAFLCMLLGAIMNLLRYENEAVEMDKEWEDLNY